MRGGRIRMFPGSLFFSSGTRLRISRKSGCHGSMCEVPKKVFLHCDKILSCIGLDPTLYWGGYTKINSKINSDTISQSR